MRLQERLVTLTARCYAGGAGPRPDLGAIDTHAAKGRHLDRALWVLETFCAVAETMPGENRALAYDCVSAMVQAMAEPVEDWQEEADKRDLGEAGAPVPPVSGPVPGDITESLVVDGESQQEGTPPASEAPEGDPQPADPPSDASETRSGGPRRKKGSKKT